MPKGVYQHKPTQLFQEGEKNLLWKGGVSKVSTYRKQHKREWDKHNKIHKKDYQKEWRTRNGVHIKEYKKKTRGRDRGREKQKRIDCPKFRIDGNMKSAIKTALKGKKAGRKWEILTGYTLEDLIKHLENKFEGWMSWDNYGRWEIDHVKPKSLFYYETAEDPEFKKCWALKNLQPLEKSLNRIKSDFYEEETEEVDKPLPEGEEAI